MSPGPVASRRRVVARLAGLAAATGLAGPIGARAAMFPARAVRLVVPYSVGTGPDVVARVLGERLQSRWKQAVVVDNKPGASGIVAFGDVRRTPADGHTVYLGDSAVFAVNPLVHARLPYDPVLDLAPLTLLFRATFVLWTGGDSRVASIGELLDAARRAPGQVSYASLGSAHPTQLALETLAQAAGVRMLHVPFKDVASLTTAVASGDVDLTALSHHTAAGLAARGKVRALAVGARQRVASLPEVPTLAQAGAPMVEMHPWAGLATRADTPPAVLAALQRDLLAALDDSDVRARAEQSGFELTPSTPEALRERALGERRRVQSLLAEGRLTAQ